MIWPRDGTVLSVSSRALVDACERLGVVFIGYERGEALAAEKLAELCPG